MNPPDEAAKEAAGRHEQILTRLRNDLKNNQLAIIIGAGVTLNVTADKSGKPLSRITWTGLIRNGLDYLVTECDVDISKQRIKHAYEALEDPEVDGLLDAANIMSSQMKQHGQFPTWLESVFGSLSQEIRHPDLLDILKALHEKGATLLTTYYDDVLEEHCGLRRVGRSNQDGVLRFQRGDIDGVFHIHGSYHDAHEVVLDRTNYYEVKYSDGVQDMLKTFLQYKTILFVGCGSGIEDPNFDALLKWASERHKNIPHRHCLLIRDDDSVNYQPLLRVKYGPRYEDLVVYLERLLDDNTEAQSLARPPRTHEDYQIGVICALATEKTAMAAMLDETHSKLKKQHGDENEYTLGRIGVHNVVIACLPAGLMGNGPAAIVANNMQRSFPIKFGLMVGIGGGVWSKSNDIRLGDVVVGQPTGAYGGVVQWDFGKTGKVRKFQRTGSLNKPPPVLLHALQELKTFDLTDGVDIKGSLSLMVQNKPQMGQTYRYQGADHDQLFEATYDHEGNETCDGCDPKLVVQRLAREDFTPRIHYGNIASGNKVIKYGTTRDKIAKEEGVICFEMEAAGLMDNFRCLVIRGICDYADSHKNKIWQPYAAATAAAFTRVLLGFIDKQEVIKTSLPQKPLMVLPFSRNRDFVGRQSQINRLIAILHTRDTNEVSQRIALVGLGGVGKTQIALECAFQLQKILPVLSVFWVRASDVTSFDNAYRDIGQQLEIPELEDDKTDVKRLVKTRLSQKSTGKWLMIVDNADNFEIFYHNNNADGRSSALSEYLPFSPLGAILFTTRDRKAATRYAGSNVIGVDEMDDTEARNLLQRSLQNKQLTEDKDGTIKLLTSLVNLPLAIMQAATYLNTNISTIAEYLKIYEESSGNVIRMKNPFSTTWFISFQQIQDRDPLAADFMAFISCIKEQDIPRDLLPPASEFDKIEALGTLKSFGFIKERTDGASYDMHRLVHMAMQNWLKFKDKWNIWNQKTLEQITNIFPWPQHENRAVWMMYLPHAQYTIATFNMGLRRTKETNKLLGKLLHNLGECSRIEGQYAEAEAIYRRTLQLRETVLGKEHPDTLTSMNSLAESLYSQGKYAKAEVMHRQTLQLQETVLGKDHPETLRSTNKLIRSLRQQGKYETLADLALNWWQQGRSGEAERLQVEVVENMTRMLGKEHHDTTTAMSNLEKMLRERSKLADAEDMFQQATGRDGKEYSATRDVQMNVKLEDRNLLDLSDNTEVLAVETMSVASVDDNYNQMAFDIESGTTSAGSLSGSSPEESGTTAPSAFSSAVIPTVNEDSERDFSSMIFYNYTIPAPQDTLDQNSDVQSVLSIDDDISSTAESDSASSAFREAAADYVVKNFADDNELLALYQDATKRLDEARFVRNHRRLLKIYFLDLQSEEQSPSQNLAIKFLRPRSERTLISTKIRHIFRPSDTTVREKINVLLGKERDTLFLLNRHLEQEDSTARSPGGIQATIPSVSIQGMEDTISETSESSDDEADNDNEKDVDGTSDNFTKLKSAVDFLTAGRPFNSYKANLRKFLDPGSKLDSVQLPCALSFPIVEKLQYGIASLVMVVLLVVVMLDATRIRLRYSLWKSIVFLYDSKVGPPNPIFETPQDTPSDICREELSYSSSISSLRKPSVYAFHSIRSLFLSSELPPHITRIRWTCDCGHQSYDDFISERRVVKAIADRLFRSGIKVEIITRRESGIATLLLMLKGMAWRRHPGAYREPRQSASGDLQASGSLGAVTHNLSQDLLDNSQDISEVELQSLGREPIQELQWRTEDDVRFLHLCLHMEFSLPCMQHFMIDPRSVLTEIINCDQQLFKEIKKRHVEARRRRMSVFVKLKGIYFVQYQLFPRTLVGGLKENQTPTDTSEYDFKEVRELKDGDSPIPPNVMLHFYDEPEHIMDDRLCLDAFPKRKIEPLYWKRGQSNVGYGIYLKEEPDEMLFALIRCCIAFSVGLIGWSVFLMRRDLEKNYPWAGVLWVSGIGVCALEVLKEWLKARFESGTTKAKTE